jgi:hypothetical protein
MMTYPTCYKCKGSITLTQQKSKSSEWRMVERKKSGVKVAYHHQCSLWGF